VAQHREQVLANTFDHAPVDERAARRMRDLELEPACTLHDLDAEIAVVLEEPGRVVGFVPGIQHCERAASEEIEQPRIARQPQLLDFPLRKQLQDAARAHLGIDGVRALNRWYDVHAAAPAPLATMRYTAFAKSSET